MNWKTTFTDRGLAILAGAPGGRAFFSAWAGTGVIPDEHLGEQTALMNPKQQLAIIEDGTNDNKRFLRLQVINDNIMEAYSINQIGIFVSIDGKEPVLYFIAQSESGNDIPSNVEKGFIAEYLITLVFSSNMDVVYDTSVQGFITADALEARLSNFRVSLDYERPNVTRRYHRSYGENSWTAKGSGHFEIIIPPSQHNCGVDFKVTIIPKNVITVSDEDYELEVTSYSIADNGQIIITSNTSSAFSLYVEREGCIQFLNNCL